MKSSKFPDSSVEFPVNRSGFLCMRSVLHATRPLAALAPLLLALAVAAQQLPQNGSTSSSDCADPLNAGTQQCQSTVGLSPSLGLPATPAAQNPVQPSMNGTYIDNENTLRAVPQGLTRFRPLPPEPLTEFQKFIASTTSLVLPIYGVDLFQHVPSTFSPLNGGPVPASYIVGPGDELRIRVWGQVSFQANIRVDRSGDIYLPHVGPVHVAGLRFSELDSHLRTAVGRVYRNFDLTVDMGQIRSIQIYVAGQARRPGVYTVSSLSTLVDALFASGGPSVHGSLRHIELHRDGALVTDFDLYDLLVRGDKSKDVKLQPEDVIYIPPVGAEVAVTGSVRNPAIYELRGNESLGQLLNNTGGITAVASATGISIERIADHRDRSAMEVAYNKSGLATPLENGDLIHVNSIIPNYRKTVTLRGNVANPGRFTWHKGMRVSDLIPDKDSLVTRNYWWRRAQQGLPAPEFEPSPELSTLRQPTYPVRLPSFSALPPGSMPQQNPSGAPGEIAPRASAESAPQAAADYQYPSATPNGQQLDQQQLYPNQYGQQPYSQYSPNGEPNPNAQGQNSIGHTATLAAEQQRGYTGLRGATKPTEVSVVAPEIDWDYATIERLDPETLKTKLVPFDLGRLVLNHDQSQNLELQPGDVVTIFSEADIRLPRSQQTKLIKLEGEFVHAGIYTAKAGETLREIVERAGGLTRGAYLYGSEFSRESTRAVQQARIDEYVQSVEMEMQRGTMALIAAGSGNNSVAQNGQSAAGIAGQELVSRLRRIRATGRIVLEFKPGTSGVSSLPDIQLEDGDVFVVPAVPASVNVVGAVYNQNSFLYVPSRKVAAYLRLAGGPNRSADRHHAFIIRADGEVVSRAAMNGPWGNSFESLRLNPGDTIVVPDKAIKPPVLRAITDWSSMFSQFALGAAYLTVLP